MCWEVNASPKMQNDSDCIAKERRCLKLASYLLVSLTPQEIESCLCNRTDNLCVV